MVPIAAEPIFNIGSFSITNTLIDTLIIDVIIVALIFFVSKGIKYVPGSLQNVIEMVIEIYYNLIESIIPEKVQVIFPFAMTFFLFILLINWSGLIPGVGTIGVYENHSKNLIPLIRAASSDLNLTLALALISVISTHILSIRYTGIKDYLGRYFSLNPINLFVGLLEIVLEFAKIVSFSFRLFGNIFAGEVVIFTISAMFAFIIPLPFMALEIIVGGVQALVFSMLTMAFMVIFLTPHHQVEHSAEKILNKTIAQI